jgi:hypothetical protein
MSSLGIRWPCYNNNLISIQFINSQNDIVKSIENLTTYKKNPPILATKKPGRYNLGFMSFNIGFAFYWVLSAS